MATAISTFSNCTRIAGQAAVNDAVHIRVIAQSFRDGIDHIT
jgi:hypothetical protein